MTGGIDIVARSCFVSYKFCQMTSTLNPFEPSSRPFLFPLRLQSERDLSSSGLGILSGGHGGVDPLRKRIYVSNEADK